MRKLIFAIALLAGISACQPQSYKFAVLCDTRSDADNSGVDGVNVSAVKAVCTHLKASGAEFVIAPGDFICGNVTWYNSTKTPPANSTQYQAFLEAMRFAGVGLPGDGKEIVLYPVRGNHECYQQILDEKDIEAAWLQNIGSSLPPNGPSNEIGFTYSFVHKGSLFVGLDQYMHANAAKDSSITINQKWLDNELLKHPDSEHIFAFGHTPAFAAQHQDCLGSDSLARNTFLQAINSRSGVYFCGHDHFYARAEIPVYNTDGGIDNFMQQVITPSGAPFLGGFSPKWNEKYRNKAIIAEKYLDEVVGYQLVTVDGKKVSVEFIATLDASTHTVDTTGKYNYTYNDSWEEWNFSTMDKFTYELP